MSGWVSRFGCPRIVITDQGVQFESTLWRQLMLSLGTKRDRTTAYHPQTNGLIERVHRRLKEGIKTQPEPHKWVDSLPNLLLYLHATPATDTNVSPAEYVFGEELKLPGQFCTSTEHPTNEQTLLEMINHAMRTRAPPTREPNKTRESIPASLMSVDEVLIRVDAVKRSLQPPYQGPYKVLKRTPKFFTVEKSGSPYTVNIDRLKPFHRELPATSIPSTTATKENHTSDKYITRSGRISRPPNRF